MTREELSQMVELLRDTAKIHQPNEEILTDVKAESFIFVMDSVLSALSENKGEWIPVSERLPEKNMACLVAVGEFNLTQMAMYSDLMGTIDHRIFYQGDVGYDNFVDITEYINAWQPLPEPYKAESEDK